MSGIRAGRLLGERYRVVDEIGRGGMGVVYEALDTVLDRRVAVKVVLDASRREHLLEEARLVAQLGHAAITPVFDFGVDDGAMFLVMPLLEGEPLRRVLEDGPLDEIEAVRIAWRVVEALAASHARRIIHRDIKPENIMLVPVRGGSEVQVLDFGVASRSTPGLAAGSNERIAVWGTPPYLSPEQALGDNADARSDLYSLGVVLYECLAGKPPFGGSPIEAMIAVVNTPPRPIEEVRPGIDPSLAALVMSLLEPRPSQRPGSAEEVAHRLGEIHRRLGEVGDRTDPVFAPPELDSLIGRTHELSALRWRWSQARNGTCQLVLVEGEAGSGKSALLAELEREVAASGARVARGSFSDADDELPYHAFVTALGQRLGLAERPSRAALFETVATAILDATRGALLLVLEDVHGADASLDLLAYLFQRLANHPVLIAASHRPVAVPHRLALLRRRLRSDRRFESLALGSLSSEHQDALLARELGGEVTPELAAQVRELTDGNPGLLREVVASLRLQGALVRSSTGALAVPAALRVTLPPTAHDLLGARLAELGAAERALLEAGAVLGRTFEYDELAAIAGGHDLDDELAALTRRGLVCRAPDGGRDRFRFESAALREVMHARMPVGRRRALHRRVAEMLRTRTGTELAGTHRLLVHYAAAGLGSAALEQALIVADAALAAHAPEDVLRASALVRPLLDPPPADAAPALALLTALAARARFALGDVPAARAEAEGAVALLGDTAASPVRMRILLAAAELAWEDRDAARATEWSDRALQLAHGLGDARAITALSALRRRISGELSPAALPEGAVLLRGELLLMQGEYNAAVELLEAALLAPEVQPSVRARLLLRLGTLAQRLGRARDAEARLDAGLVAAAGHCELLVELHALRVLVLVEAGRDTEASAGLAAAETALAGVPPARRAGLAARLERARGNLLLRRGAAAAAVAAFEAGRSLLDRAEDPWEYSIADYNCAEARMWLGELDRAKIELDRAEATKQLLDDRWGLAYVAWARARLLLSRGQPRIARDAAGRGLELAHAIGDPTILGALASTQAIAALRCDDLVEAQRWAHQALRDARGSVRERIAAELAMAEVDLAQGEPVLARERAMGALLYADMVNARADRSAALLVLARAYACDEPATAHAYLAEATALTAELGMRDRAIEARAIYLELAAPSEVPALAEGLIADAASAGIVAAQAGAVLRALERIADGKPLRDDRAVALAEMTAMLLHDQGAPHLAARARALLGRA